MNRRPDQWPGVNRIPNPALWCLALTAVTAGLAMTVSATKSLLLGIDRDRPSI